MKSLVKGDKKKTILSLVKSLRIRLTWKIAKIYESCYMWDHYISHKIKDVVDMKKQDGKLCKIACAKDDEY